ncbi:TPM domain-containing protein [Muricauda oceani]|uniref:TPM domain-containing protein n=1 Tax=Flagellimonas oceani TaxID=2698672 RepID=A0A6G7J6D0_9FLAO|nr:TPM domain-containing protein [Allomuricauda oceani]MBW8242215.1 TPM domain-containing protein [Allomuricauda oceani]QII45977.1 TPM domain-containing protein [Allomuricauda oceani]
MLKTKCFGLIFLICSLCAAQLEYPKLTEIVTDNAQIFTPSQLEELRTKLYQFESETTNQLVVLTIDDLGNETIEQYALMVFNQNKLGQSGDDNGVLILFSELDRKVRIEVGYGLEPYITDAVASRIIRNTMIPRVKEENYFEGIDLATDQIIEFLNNPEALDEFKAEIDAEAEVPWWLYIIIGLFLMMFVAAGGFVFYKGYSTVIEIIRGIFTGKLAVVRGVFMGIFMMFPLIFGLVFIGIPLFFMAMLLGYDDLLNGMAKDFTWVFGVILTFIVITVLLAILKIRKKGDKDFKLSLFKSDKTYIKKTFSSSGTHSFGSSSRSGSSSSFSGGGGSSGGGGASGSW